MTKICVLYARVSTPTQDPMLQLADLRQYAQQRQLQIYKEYVDQGISGSISSRPQLNLLMDEARKRKFDTVLVWRFDRFARNSQHLINVFKEFKSLGIDFISYRENIDTSTPMGEAMFTVISAMAQLERDIISERVQAGLTKAKQNGIQLGRPIRQFRTELALELRSQGKSVREIASLLNIPKSTLHKRLKPKTPLSQKPSSKIPLLS